ncbi:MAG: hypothetical protein AAB511_01055 [Patescibacteria group bacterium]
MNKSWKHHILVTIISLLVALPTLVGFSEKANAEATACLAGIISGITSAMSGGIGNVATVPVGDSATLNSTAQTSGQTTGSTIQRCVVEPLVTVMARSLLENFTAQTVRWINSGFQGSPMYVTNIQGFFGDVADQAAGQFIAGLGPIGQMLCSPFDLQLRLSLGLQYSSNYRQLIGCRLSDIQNNVQRAFTGGQFGRNGWDNWINLTATPQNNIYGSYLKATEAIDLKIGNTQISLGKQLDFGKGFLSSKDANGNITTPGSIIEGQLDKTLYQPLQNIGLAKDIDAILNALVGQMINQVMGGIGGLMGASNSSAGGGQSAVDRGINQTVTALMQQNSQSQILPSGFIMNTGTGTLNPTGSATGPTPISFCYQFSQNIYGTNADPQRPGDVYVKVNGVTNPSALQTITSKIVNATTVPWTVSDYNSIYTYCQNVNRTSVLSAGTNAFTGQVEDIIGNQASSTPANPTLTNQNLTRLPGVTAKQSSTYLGWNYYPEARIAIDGQTYGSSNYGLAMTQARADQWWQVDLGNTKQIGTIKIYREPNGNYLSYPFHVFVLNSDPDDVPLDAFLVGSAQNTVVSHTFVPDPTAMTAFGTNGSNFMTLNLGNVSGRFVRVTQSVGSYVGLAEVEIFSPTTGTSAGGPAQPPIYFSSPEIDRTATPLSRMGTFENSVFLVANEDLSDLRAKMTIAKIGYSYNQGVPGFPTIFRTLNVTSTRVQTSEQIENTDIVVLNTIGCGGWQQTCNGKINPIFGLNNLLNPVTYDQALSVVAGQQIQMVQSGIISSLATSGTYRITLDITTAGGSLLASQKITFSIQ